MALKEEPQEIKLDFSGFKDSLIEALCVRDKTFVKAIVEELRKQEGIVTGKRKKGQLRVGGPTQEKLIEQLKTVGKEKNSSLLTEQWTVVIPNYTNAETSAGLRDYVWVDELLKDEPGDQANIPYVKDADFVS